jgi:hypothetical protein
MCHAMPNGLQDTFLYERNWMCLRAVVNTKEPFVVTYR